MQKLSLLFMLLSAMLSAQNKAFIYDFGYRANLKKDSLKSEKMTLDVAGSRSVFRSVKQKEYDSIFVATGNRRSLSMGLEHQFFIVKDLKTNSVQKIFEIFQDRFALKIDEPLNWKIEKEKKKIGDFNCQKATVDYGGRSWTAWFAPEIPIQDGPYIFHGLPGLIAEVSDANIEYKFVLTQIKKGSENLFLSDKNLPIKWKTFSRLAQEYYGDPYKNMKPNSAGMGSNYRVKYTDENGKEIIPDFNQWTKDTQKKIREENNPIELSHKIDYK